jgi:hypothetical protein
MILKYKETEHVLSCVDCGTAFPGMINVSSEDPHVGLAWLCQTCVNKYPSTAAVRSRVTDCSMKARK